MNILTSKDFENLDLSEVQNIVYNVSEQYPDGSAEYIALHAAMRVLTYV
jgi:hypothetical protein